MASLYEIDGRVWDVIQHGMALCDETGEVWDDEAFEALEMERKDKLEAVALYVKNCESDAQAIKEEERSLAERRKVLENRAQRMRDYVQRSMETFGDDRLETPRVALSFRRSSVVELDEGVELPERFLRVKVEADKTAIKAAIKSGEHVDGARIVERRTLQVK